jgi:hypothetical protein
LQKGNLKTHINRIHQKAIPFKIEVSSENCQMEGNDPITEQISPDMAEQNQSANNWFEQIEPIYLSEDPLDMGTVQKEENSKKCTFCGKCFSIDEALVTHVASFVCH